MKRDWDLIRSILEKTEAIPSNGALNTKQGWPDDPVSAFEHIALLEEAGYVKAAVVRFMDGGPGGEAILRRLTSSGHDLLDKIRSDTVWEKTKEKAKSAGVDLTFDTVKEIAQRVILSLLG